MENVEFLKAEIENMIFGIDDAREFLTVHVEL
jgi:hypothetical protein